MGGAADKAEPTVEQAVPGARSESAGETSSRSPHRLLALQQRAGNRAVAGLIGAGSAPAALQRTVGTAGARAVDPRAREAAIVRSYVGARIAGTHDLGEAESIVRRLEAAGEERSPSRYVSFPMDDTWRWTSLIRRSDIPPLLARARVKVRSLRSAEPPAPRRPTVLGPAAAPDLVGGGRDQAQLRRTGFAFVDQHRPPASGISIPIPLWQQSFAITPGGSMGPLYSHGVQIAVGAQGALVDPRVTSRPTALNPDGSRDHWSRAGLGSRHTDAETGGGSASDTNAAQAGGNHTFTPHRVQSAANPSVPPGPRQGAAERSISVGQQRQMDSQLRHFLGTTFRTQNTDSWSLQATRSGGVTTGNIGFGTQTELQNSAGGAWAQFQVRFNLLNVASLLELRVAETVLSASLPLALRYTFDDGRYAELSLAVGLQWSFTPNWRWLAQRVSQRIGAQVVAAQVAGAEMAGMASMTGMTAMGGAGLIAAPLAAGGILGYMYISAVERGRLTADTATAAQQGLYDFAMSYQLHMQGRPPLRSEAGHRGYLAAEERKRELRAQGYSDDRIHETARERGPYSQVLGLVRERWRQQALSVSGVGPQHAAVVNLAVDGVGRPEVDADCAARARAYN